MSDLHHVSRRKMILTSGILVTSLARGSSASGQTSDNGQQLIVRSSDPPNAEPALQDLVDSWITPLEHFYIRSHAGHPRIDAARYRLKVAGMVQRELSLSLEELKELGRVQVTATLTCAGNRREEFNQQAEVGGVQWQAGAIGNATWTGVPLHALLKLAGVDTLARHVWFDGLDEIDHEGEVIPFGASIPIEKAQAEGDIPGALLAYAMNGEELSVDHGFPLRTVVPGYIGARSVKWLGKITVADRPSDNHFLATAYKLVRDTQPLDWAEAGPIYRYPINAAAASPEAGRLKPGMIKLRGYVLPSGIESAQARQVLVSVDEGQQWKRASLTGERSAYCWQLWEAEVDVTSATKEIIIRANDSEGGFMPARTPWNAKGYLQNAWYRIPIEVE